VIIPDAGVKAAGGGFTVGRLGTGKAAGDEDYLKVTPDSTRIFVSESSNNGFSVGKIGGTSSPNFLNLTPDNYFIGHRAGESITTGLYNTFIGFEAGLNTTSANRNVFLGFNAGRTNTLGALNIFIGNEAGLNFSGESQDLDAEENIYIGNSAGYNCTSTANSIFIGTRSGYNCGESYSNTFIGDRTGSLGAAGNENTLIGSAAGMNIGGSSNVFIGAGAGVANTSGSNNVFIGTGAGGQEEGSDRLYIANSNTADPLIFGNFAEGLVQVSGNLYASGEVASNSDIRLKENIIPLVSGLDIVMALKGYYYNWNEDAKKQKKLSDRTQLGFIAQEVEKVVPEIVTTAPNGYKAINYTKLTPILVEAIKDQQAQIETLEAENRNLKEQVSKIVDMQNEIECLKKMTEKLYELLEKYEKPEKD
ncbi:MAG: hypothetical protein HC831_21865, partial [Chloroflexia bacterium]|nr:hypothetical protein [Chloroflexia bacterium]